MTSNRYFDWRGFHAREQTVPSVVDSQRRLRWCLAGFALLLLVVFGRMVQLELNGGPEFRALAAQPLSRRQSVPGVRGRILAAGGTVMAFDKNVPALAVHYRYLQDPPDAGWLRRQVRSRLDRTERKDARRVAEEEARVLAEREQVTSHLAQLSGVSIDTWRDRARRVQSRVERIADSVNRRRQSDFERRRTEETTPGDEDSDSGSLGDKARSFARGVLSASMDESAPSRITVAEELDYHVIVEDLPLEVVAEIEAHADRYPGARIVQRRRRAYPFGSLAAHLLGHLGPIDEDEDLPGAYHPEDLIGKEGVERQYEERLRGRRGEAVELTDRSGRVLSAYRSREPQLGRDLVLTLDVELQQTAERLLAAALARRTIQQTEASPAGGACVVMDVRSGAILAAASAPGFDPNVFSGGTGEDAGALLEAPGNPLFNRVTKMAIPPGSVFKVVTATALLAESDVSPHEPHFCQGYLESPDRWRCAVFRRHGTGHGEVTLSDALTESCNVYFFHHAGCLGPEALVQWGWQFGYGRPTGVDLPSEAEGTLPLPSSAGMPEEDRRRDRETLAMAIGQGSLEATPLQVVRMMAAVANGGRLVSPHVVSRLGLPPGAEPGALPDDPIHRNPPTPIEGLDASTLRTIREGLRRVVCDPQGTGHGTVWLETVEVAGKTGTAETGTDDGDHAWFAGYAPAGDPKLAFVVALEHAGDAAEAAGPVAKRLVLAMQERGHLDRRSGPLAARKADLSVGP